MVFSQYFSNVAETSGSVLRKYDQFQASIWPPIGEVVIDMVFSQDFSNVAETSGSVLRKYDQF
jgi:hypothetical protein